jgi:hypothetical protein
LCGSPAACVISCGGIWDISTLWGRRSAAPIFFLGNRYVLQRLFNVHYHAFGIVASIETSLIGYQFPQFFTLFKHAVLNIYFIVLITGKSSSSSEKIRRPVAIPEK